MKKRFVLCMLAIMVMIVAGCGENNKNKNKLIDGSSVTPMPSTAKESSEALADGLTGLTGILISIDKENSQIVLRDVYANDTYILTYNGGTDIKTQYDNVITMEQIELGEIVDVKYNADKKKASSVYINKEAFRSDRITGFKAVVADNTILFGSGKYMYKDDIVVVSGKKLLAPTEVMARDQVTVRGFDKVIYSVTVDKGHGYLSFSGIEDFVGGMLEVGNSFLYTIAEDMMIVLPEGRFDITLTKGELVARKSVYIAKDQTATIDFGEYKAPASKTGTVEFQILPKGTYLYIEGEHTPYDKPVTLEYGNYIINLVNPDYPTFTTHVLVDSTYQIQNFDLEKLNKADPDATGQPETSGSSGMATSGSSNSGSTTATTNSTTTQGTTSATTSTGESTTSNKKPATTTGSVSVTIEKPANAEVYVDNVYVGTAPVTINKDPGEYVITFKRSGYNTKSYVVDVDSTDGKQTFGFPEMSEE